MTTSILFKFLRLRSQLPLEIGRKISRFRYHTDRAPQPFRTAEVLTRRNADRENPTRWVGECSIFPQRGGNSTIALPRPLRVCKMKHRNGQRTED
ncbi:MAG: hypothetical protein SVX43_00345 [Cyanobacteriota bacterium]|nr:hypothetical protein [Cyanobacteriota bacterium]